MSTTTLFQQQLLDIIPIPIFIKNEKYIYIECNKSFEDFLGKDRQEIIGKSVHDIAPAELAAVYHEKDQELINSPGVQIYEFEVKNKSKGNRQVVFHKATFGRDDGQVTGLVGVILDITERKKAEEQKEQLLSEIIESEERYRTLFENATDIIQTVRADGKLLDVNSSWCAALGYSIEEAEHLNIFDIIHPDCEDECIVNFKRALNEGTTGTIETIFTKKDGEKVILQGSANCNYINGQPSYVHCIFHDITEQRRLEDELIKMHKLESIGLLAGGIAHDFNNILTVLTGNLSLARMHLDPDHKVHKRIEEAEKATFRARDLTQQLLTFSRGGDPIKRTASIIELVKDSSQFVLRGSNVRCDFDLQQDLWLVELDEGQISQVLNNLLINADQAMPEGGTITIHAENVHISSNEVPSLKEGDYVAVSVEDQGAGISEKYLSKIFDPYFSTKHKGQGLGLATAYSIIKKHDGFLAVDSALEKGSVFRFYLPASPEKEVRQVSAGEGVHIGKGLILLMDDDEKIREIGREMLEHMGYQVKTASDGQQALELYIRAMLENTPFDAVIMDLTVPGGMGGKETMAKLLEIDPSATVIVSSGYTNDTVMANYKQFGFSAIVTKPYKIEDVSKVLKSLLHSE